jgi:hypothetical protein
MTYLGFDLWKINMMDPDNVEEYTSTEGALPLNDSKYGDHRSLTYFLRIMLAEC